MCFLAAVKVFFAVVLSNERDDNFCKNKKKVADLLADTFINVYNNKLTLSTMPYIFLKRVISTLHTR